MMHVALILTLWRAVAASPTIPDQVAGVRRGESICVSDRAACTDERVVYYISAVDEEAGVVSIRADKIVNGQAVTMGTGEWKQDAERHTLRWKTPRQTWPLRITDDTIEGTLTLADKTIVRRMTLKEDR